MKLYASPLQGFTEAPWRNIHHELFGLSLKTWGN